MGMNSKNKKTYRRILIYGIFVVFLLISIALLSNIIAYFNTGANQYISSFTKTAISTHTPEVNWSYSPSYDSDLLDDALRETIEKAYVQSWYVINRSIESNSSIVAIDYLSPALKASLDTLLTNQKRWKIQRVDLSHHLEVNLVSLDRQFISFTDKDVEIKKLIWDRNSNELISNTIEKADYNVILALNDGIWRIQHIHKTSINRMPQKEMVGIENDSTFFSCEDGSFLMAGEKFNVRGVNYYPAYSPWLKFWDNFDIDTIQRDLRKALDLNFNTIRIFVPYGKFGKGTVSKKMLSRLDQLVTLTEELQLAMIITLFDFPEGYSLHQYAGTDRQLETIMTRYADKKTILAWDIKNEPDQDFNIHGKENVINWLEFIIQRAREYAPRQLITIGWSKSQYASLLSDKLDFVSFHYYNGAHQLQSTLDDLRTLLTDKTFMVQETGLPSSSYLFIPGGGSEKSQSEYLETVLNTLQKEGEIPYCLWTLYDFSDAPSEVFGWKPWIRHVQKNYGILRVDGSLKPASELFLETD